MHRKAAVLPALGLLAGMLTACGPGQAETPKATAILSPSPYINAVPASSTTPKPTQIIRPAPDPANPDLGPAPEHAWARLGKGRANAVAFSPDGVDIAVASNIGVFVYRADTLGPVWSAALDGWKETLAYSPDGTLLAAGVGENQVRVWDAATGTEVAQWEIPLSEDGPWGLCALAFAPAGDLLAGMDMNYIYFWNPADGGLVRTIDPNGGSSPCGLDFSPDGKTLAAALGSRLTLWNPADGHEILEMKTADSMSMGGGGGYLTGVSFFPDSRSMLSTDGAVWDAASGKILRTLEGWGGMTVALSPDGALAADDTGMWNPKTGSLLWEYPPGAASIFLQAAFSPDSGTLAVTSGVGVLILDSATGELRNTLAGHFAVEGVAFSKDGRSLISWDETSRYRVWDAASLRLEHSFPGPFCGEGCERIAADRPIELSAPASREQAVSPDGRFTAVLNGRDPVEVTDAVQGGRVIAVLPPASGAAFSPDGALLATTDASGGYYTGSILLWEMTVLEKGAMPPPPAEPTPTAAPTPTSGPTPTPLPGTAVELQAGAVVALGYSADGTRLTAVTAEKVFVLHHGAVASKWSWLPELGSALPDADVSPDGSRIVRGSGLWDAATGRLIWTFTLDDSEVWLEAPAFSADGTLVAGYADGQVGVWNAGTGRLVRAMESEAFIEDLAFSPDGKTLSGGSGTQLRLWELQTGGVFEPETILCRGDTTYDQAYSPDGAVLLIACGPSDYPLGFLSFWDVPGGQLDEYWDETSSIHRLAYAPNGNLAALGLYDGHIRLWGPEIGITLPAHSLPREGEDWNPFGEDGALKGVDHEVTALAFSPDSRTLASGSLDGTLLLTNVSSVGVVQVQSRLSTAAPSGCGLTPGMTVHAGENARLWTLPDVSQGEVALEPASGQTLIVEGGPVMGWLKADQSKEGWFWEMSTSPGAGSAGWLWQNRIMECVGP